MKARNSTGHTNIRLAQRGSALIVGLLLLVIMTVLGLSAMGRTTLQERMAGNSQVQAMIFQLTSSELEAQIQSLRDDVDPLVTLLNDTATPVDLAEQVPQAGVTKTRQQLSFVTTGVAPGYSVGEMVGYYVEVDAEAQADNNPDARSWQTQGLVKVAPALN